MAVNTISSSAIRDPVDSPKYLQKPVADKEASPSREKDSIAKNDEAAAKEEKAKSRDVGSFVKSIDLGNKSISFTVNEELEQVVAKITDSDTGEIIREVPSKELQDIAIRLQEAAGRLLDTII